MSPITRRFNAKSCWYRTDAGPEVLDYLAKNGASATRRAIAANPATPPESNLLLAGDIDCVVRKALAGKIGRLFPGLLAEEQKQLRDMTIATLEKLARDEVSEVRAILAEEVKHHDCLPKRVVTHLASDSDPKVCLPVIEFSPLLDDRVRTVADGVRMCTGWAAPTPELDDT